jgi:parallel beta helix pectate lyase-like protein
MRPSHFLTRAFALLAVAAAAGAAPAAATALRASTSPVVCGDVITTDKALVANLTCAGDGLTVTNGALLDLQGHKIMGNGTGQGVHVLGTGTVLTNGVVTGFDTGVHVEAQSGRVEDLVVKNNANRGIYLDGFHGGGGVMQRNTITANGIGIRLFIFNGVQVLDNMITDNTADGILAPDQDDGVLYQGNHVLDNGGYGMRISESISTILDNHLNDNGLDGLRADEPVPSAIPLWLIGGNHANHNGGHGLNVETPGIPDGGGNKARNNALDPQCVNLVC